MRVHVGGCWHTLESALILNPSTLEEHEKNAMIIVRQWLDGKAEFTFHTSGSSGSPKPMTFRRAQLETSAKLTAKVLGLTDGMKALACLDVNFVAGTMMIIRSLVTRMDLMLKPPIANPLKALSEAIDFIALVPLQVSAVLRDSRAKLDAISTVIIGGAPLSRSAMDQLRSHPGACYASYGMTETLTHIALQRLSGPNRQEDFHLLSGIHARTDERGCLVIHAPHLGVEPVITNDQAEFTGAQTFRILGRIDQVINSGGIKIQISQVEKAVEDVLDELGIGIRFFIAPKPDDQLGERVCLILEGSPLENTVAAVMMEGVRKRLSKFEVPKEIQYAATFTETSTQKIDRRATLGKLKEKK